MGLKILVFGCGIFAYLSIGLTSAGHRTRRAYYPYNPFYYGATTPLQQQQPAGEVRRSTVYPGYNMMGQRTYYPGYVQQPQQSQQLNYGRMYMPQQSQQQQQVPYYEQMSYQAPTPRYSATPFSNTVSPNKRTLYSYNTNPYQNALSAAAPFAKRYAGTSLMTNIQKPIKMIDIPFKENTSSLLLHARNQVQTVVKPSSVLAYNGVSNVVVLPHKRRHNGTLMNSASKEKYRDRGVINRLNNLIKGFHHVHHLASQSKHLRNFTLSTSRLVKHEGGVVSANRRHNGTNPTVPLDTFEVEDTSVTDGHSKQKSETSQTKERNKGGAKINNVVLGSSKKNESASNGEMDVLELVESNKNPSKKKAIESLPQQRHILTTAKLQKVSNSTNHSTKASVTPTNGNKKQVSSDPVSKTTGLEKVAETLKDGWNEMANTAVNLLKGDPKKIDLKLAEDAKQKKEDEMKELDHEKLQHAIMSANIKQQEASLSKDITGENLYDPTLKIVEPKTPHALVNDALHGDWFDTAREPNEKTKNDIKISSDVIGEISKTKMKGKKLEDIQQQQQLLTAKPESKKQYESRVKKITSLAESTENEILSGLIQGSLGDAMPDKKPLKIKNIEKFAKVEDAGGKPSAEKTDLGNIQKLLSKYNDDFDVFVDKTVDNHLLSTQPGVGKVVKHVNTLMDILPENEQNGMFPPPPLSDVTGNKKNYESHSTKGKSKNITLIDSSEDDDETLMKRLTEKWKMFKESNKDVFDDKDAANTNSNNKHIVEDKEDGSKTASQKSKLTAAKRKEKDILSSYFDQVEQKQADAQSKELETRQTKRKEKLKSTLHMISDIEREIDSLVNKETVNTGEDGEAEKQRSAAVEKQLTTSNAVADKKEHKKKKGKAEIFKELTGGDGGGESIKDVDASVAIKSDSKKQEELNYMKETPDQYTDGQLTKTSMENEGKDQVIASYEEADEQEAQQPENYMATPQYENAGKDNAQISPAVKPQHQPQHQPQQMLLEQEVATSSPSGGTQQPEEQIATEEEKQFVEETPGVASSGGRTIENAIKSTDQSENLFQASDLKNFQQEELKGDMARVQQTTQNGLRDMFNVAVQKQQNFINKVQGGSERGGGEEGSEVQNQPATSPVSAFASSLIAAAMPVNDLNNGAEAPEQVESENTAADPQAAEAITPEGMAGDPQSMFGSPDKWQQEGNNEPFNVIKDDIPETDSADPSPIGEENPTRKSQIMELVQPASNSNSADTDDSDDNGIDENDNDNDVADEDEDDADPPTDNGGGGGAMFMAVPLSSS